MSSAFRIHPRASLEILEAAAWYADQGSGVADNFIKALDATLLRIRDNPLQYQVVKGEFRRAGLHRFPYAIVYSATGGEVTVVGCVHGRRDPRRWKNRT